MRRLMMIAGIAIAVVATCSGVLYATNADFRAGLTDGIRVTR